MNPTKTAIPNEAIGERFNPKEFLKTVNSQPGVYRMLDEQGIVIYVGKAKNLKNRLSSYFHQSVQSEKTRTLVKHIHSIEVINTRTEGEALLLENDLIKNLNPRYNILFRDDKSYPYILLTRHPYPRIRLYRGSTATDKGTCYGPYPSAGSVRWSINHLQSLFKLRNCEDSAMKNRSRPCLQYQIKRCTAPCVDFVNEQEYAKQIHQVELFLKGKNEELIALQISQMEAASEQLKFEKAAEYRDTIEQLRRLTEQQFVTGFNGNMDIIACALEQDYAAIQVFMIRNGTSLGNKVQYIKCKLETLENEILSTFLMQHYTRHPVTDEILLSHSPENLELLEQVLCTLGNSKTQLKFSVRGKRKRAVEMALHNARESLQRYLASKSKHTQQYLALIELLELPEPPKRIECFDISHTMGEETRASCVVFDDQGAVKTEYRLYNIKGIQPGDDYAAMNQALTRRYQKRLDTPETLPDVVLIDGGKGQLNQALAVFDSLGVFQLKPELRVIGIAKGPERRAGYEVLFDESMQEIAYTLDNPALLLIQQIRDESHRFAVSGHRKARNKKRTTSRLEEIPGIGSRRRQELLKTFGGLQGVKAAGIEELQQVKGISKQLARDIYTRFH